MLTRVHLVKVIVFPVVMYGYESWPIKTAEHWRIVLLNCGVGEDSWESLGLQEDPNSPSWRRSALGVHWKDWCWSWNSNTLSTWSEELTHLKIPWSWERLKAGGEGYERGWDGWIASLTQWTWVWVNSGSWWWIGRPGVLQSMEFQKSDMTDLLKNGTEQPLWRTEWRFLKKLEIHCHTNQQSHCWAYTPRKTELKETCVPQCSSQHCLQ